jgi:hypothetical protein
MSKFETKGFGWDPESLKIESLDCRHNNPDFQRLVNYVIGELTSRELEYFIREAVDKYNPDAHRNLCWYAYQRLRFLIAKWKRQQGGSKPP